MKIELTPDQLVFVRSFNREFGNDYEEVLHGKFAYSQKPGNEPNVYDFYEFPLITTEHLEYMGWKKSKKYKHSLEKGFYTIHLDKKKLTIFDDREWHHDKFIYDGNVPNTEEFLTLIKLLNLD